MLKKPALIGVVLLLVVAHTTASVKDGKTNDDPLRRLRRSTSGNSRPLTDTLDLSKAWKLDTTGFSLDPSQWNTSMLARMQMVGAGVAFAIFEGANLVHTVGLGSFLYGLVNLNWTIVATACVAYHSWRAKNAKFLFLSGLLLYSLAFGAKWL